MTTQEKRTNALTKAATVLSKIIEIVYSVGAVSMIVGLIMFLVDRDLVQAVPGGELSVQGFTIACMNPDGSLNGPAIIIFLITAGLTLELMAWVFRNVNLILRTAQGETKFSKGKTPFQQDNVRMLREIGIFFFAIVIVQMVASWGATLAIGVEAMEVSIGMQNIVIGILMLCLSQVFAQGEQLQEDVDGLV